jgi:PAS domain S-box-containing protein
MAGKQGTAQNLDGAQRRPRFDTVTTGERLRLAKQDVLRAWAERTRERSPAARRQEPLALVDRLPKLVDDIAETLNSPSLEQTLALRRAELARDDGQARAEQAEWSLDEVMMEYHVFRRVVFDTLAHDGELPRHEREVIMQCIEAAIRNSVREFDRVRTAEREARLSDAEQRFARFVEAVKDYAIFTVDPHGIITHWNAGAERMKQYRPDEAIGNSFAMLYPDEGKRRDEPMSHLRAAASAGRFRGEGVRVRKNGERFLADVSITPFYGSDGKLAGYAKVVQDLTERNLLMQERDLSRSETERLRIEAEYRERFVQTLTHDLLTPLSAAKAAANLIARAPQDEAKVRNWSMRIADAVDRCDAMIADLLDAARLHAGEPIPVQLQDCDLARLVADAADELSTRYGDRFHVEIEGSTKGHWCPRGLRRVIDNLLSNAVKYGERSTPVTIRIRRVDERVLLAVHNFGTIISEQEQAQLFQPFHRTSQARATGRTGWGLGLALVRAIVESHGGIVKVESYPKVGTTFTIDLPVDVRGKEDEPEPVPS